MVKNAKILLESALSGTELIAFLMDYEAYKLGLNVKRLSSHIAIFRDDKVETLIHRGCTASRAAYNVTRDKGITKRIFDNAGVANSPYVSLHRSQLDDALRFAEAHDFRVVIKPSRGARGWGVFMRITDQDDFRASWSELRRLLRSGGEQNILVEERAEGANFRFVVVKKRVVGVLERLPPLVIGDGVRTIGDLVAAKNALREDNPHLRSLRLDIDSTVLQTLKGEGLNVDLVLPSGVKFALRQNANVSTGGDSIDRTDDIPRAVCDLVVRAASVVPNLEVCGVDVIAKDITDAKNSWTGKHYLHGVGRRPWLRGAFPRPGQPSQHGSCSFAVAVSTSCDIRTYRTLSA